MKLSQMPLTQARDAMVDLAVSLGEIARDPAVTSFFDETRAGKLSLADMLDMVLALLRDHYAATVSVLAVLSGHSTEELTGMTLPQIIRLVHDLYDTELKAFFTF